MAKFKCDDYINALAAIAKGLETARPAAAAKYREAVESWAGKTVDAARRNLARPNWLLNSYIGNKVLEYRDGGKIWAMAGFKFKEQQNKRDPGYYGRFQEGGWRPGGYKSPAPPHFLRTAKRENLPELLRLINEAHKEINDAIEDELKRKGRKNG